MQTLSREQATAATRRQAQRLHEEAVRDVMQWVLRLPQLLALRLPQRLAHWLLKRLTLAARRALQRQGA